MSIEEETPLELKEKGNKFYKDKNYLYFLLIILVVKLLSGIQKQ